MENRDFKGVWIPKDIYLRNDISWTEKILLIEIDSLDKGDGCWASNEYFGKFLDLSPKSIEGCLTKLKKKGLVVTRHFDGRKRFLSVANKGADPRKTRGLPPEKQGGYPPKIKGENEEEIPIDSPIKPYNQDEIAPNNTVINTMNNTLYTGELRNSQTFEEFLESKGNHMVSKIDSDGNEYDVMVDEDGKILSKSKINSFRSEFLKLTGNQTQRIKPKNESHSVFHLFSDINPAYTTWYANKTQINASKRLLEIMDLQGIRNAIQKAQTIKGDKFSPKIKTPYDLLTKLASLKDYLEAGKEYEDVF